MQQDEKGKQKQNGKKDEKEKYDSLIWDGKQVDDFYAAFVRPTLERTRFLSPALLLNLSVRSKYIDEEKAKQNELQKEEKEEEQYPKQNENEKQHETRHTTTMTKFFQRKLIVREDNSEQEKKNKKQKEKTHASSILQETILRWDICGGWKWDGEPIPQYSLSVYLCMNPRSQINALGEMQRDIMKELSLNAAKEMKGVCGKFDGLFYNALHTSQQDHVWVEIDCDTKERSLIENFIEMYGELRKPEIVIETKHGYHWIYKAFNFPFEAVKNLKKATFNQYKELSRDGKEIRKQYFTVRTDVTTPLPGTLQGGFPVRLLPALPFSLSISVL